MHNFPSRYLAFLIISFIFLLSLVLAPLLHAGWWLVVVRRADRSRRARSAPAAALVAAQLPGAGAHPFPGRDDPAGTAAVPVRGRHRRQTVLAQPAQHRL